MFVFWLLGGHPQIFLAIALAILLALVVRSHAHGADLVVESDRDQWVAQGYLIVEMTDGWHYIFHNGNRVASYRHAGGDCPVLPSVEVADITNPYTPTDWIADNYQYQWWEDGSGRVLHGEDKIAVFCMAYYGCDSLESWPMPMSHEESPKLYLSFISK